MGRAKSRRNLERMYNHCYKEVDVDFCLYCGTTSECLDHAPPLTWVGSMGSGYFMGEGIPLLLVPSCLECNSILGSVGVFTVSERRAYVASELYSRHRRRLHLDDPLTQFIKLRLQFAWQEDVPFDVVVPRVREARSIQWERASEAITNVEPKVDQTHRLPDEVEPSQIEAARLIEEFKRRTQRGTK